jgi:tRNA pseudouridine38-40 synthase
MRNFRLTLAYDGTNYAGWQRQMNGLAVQQVVEEALVPFTPGLLKPPVVAGASRTDAGVHAWGQVANVRLDLDIDAGAIMRALNVRLPPDVRVLAAEEVDLAFHARFDARGKSYRYRISVASVLPPLDRWSVWHVPGRCDVVSMRSAAASFVGRHDFSSFQGRGSTVVDAVRTVRSVDVREDGDEVWFDLEGDGFVRHMVRAIVGSLIDVGHGRRNASSVRDMLEARDRRAGGPTAPAHGLTLMAVTY